MTGSGHSVEPATREEVNKPVAWRWTDGGGYNAGWRYSEVDPRENEDEVERQNAYSVGACHALYPEPWAVSTTQVERDRDALIDALEEIVRRLTKAFPSLEASNPIAHAKEVIEGIQRRKGDRK